MITTPRWRPIKILSQIDKQLIPIPTHVPRTRVRSGYTPHSPLQRITTPIERPKRIRCARERHSQQQIRSIGALFDVGVQGAGGGQLDELARGRDLELSCGEVRGDDCGAGGRLEIFVEVGGGDGADPEVVWEEGWARVGSCYW